MDILLQDLLTEAVPSNYTTILRDLIVNKRIFQLDYTPPTDDTENAPGLRTVLAVAYGRGYVDHKGNVHNNAQRYIRAYQYKGPSASGQKGNEMPGWRLFRLDGFTNWNLWGQKNAPEPPDSRYNPNGDKSIYKVFVQADFTPGKSDGPTDLRSPQGPQKPGGGAGSKPTNPKPGDDTNEPEDGIATTAPPVGSTISNEPKKAKPKPKTVHYASTRTQKPNDKKKLKENLEDFLKEIISDNLNT